MGKFNENHLAKMLTLGIKWEDMTEEQKLQQKKEWDKIVSDPNELYCTCPRTGCRNNHNCLQCVALHRYFDGFPDCLRPVDEEMQKGVPQERRYNMHLKIQSAGNEDSGLIDEHAPDGTRERLINQKNMDIIALMDSWSKIVRNPKNRVCVCKNTDCWYHGNCVKCVALHRHFGGFPYCDRYIADKIEEMNDEYWAEQGGRPEEK